jgi:predicted DNA repair protein MutK
MSAGLFGLLDDVAALAKLAAASVDDLGAAAGKATAKAAGVVVDDTAVTPQYVHGIAAEREIPIVKRIALGSIRNKLLIILPVALMLSQWAEWLLTPILMVGGCYLAFEGMEKVWERVSGHDEHGEVARHDQTEQELIAGAVRTDLILSSEIMVIALDSVAHQSFWTRLVVLVVVAIVITVAVYGVVGLIVKMDDAGLLLTQRSSAAAQRIGHGLVAGMPRLLDVISVVGTAAMLWVGGHILVVGTDDLGWHGPHDLVHHLEHAVHGGALGWLVNTAVSAVVGLVVGAVVVGAMHLVPRRTGHGDSEIG